MSFPSITSSTQTAGASNQLPTGQSYQLAPLPFTPSAPASDANETTSLLGRVIPSAPPLEGAVHSYEIAVTIPPPGSLTGGGTAPAEALLANVPADNVITRKGVLAVSAGCVLIIAMAVFLILVHQGVIHIYN
jgi:hypothetical protein